jgi:hypothetical protein
MRRNILIYLAITLALIQWANPTAAQIVTLEEARNVAENWITRTIILRGDWGGYPSASIANIEEIRRDGLLLGYWCHIEPEGHIVVSLRRELAPVRAYSETWDGDPACDADVVDIIKAGMATIRDFIEEHFGPLEAADSRAIMSMAEFDYRSAWDILEREPSEFAREQILQSPLTNYVEGGILTTTNWGQSSPYNLFCPVDVVCLKPWYEGRCATGCVATAGAQIMKYWAWPPYGSGYPYDDPYNWTYMPDSLFNYSPQYQIDAVANLMAEVGQGCLMDYCRDGDCGSGAYPEDMVVAYENYFRFDPDLHLLSIGNYTQTEWFELIKQQLNVNRPLHYGITGHSVVVDGYQHDMAIRLYHINYGWSGNYGEGECWDPYRDAGIPSNTWYTVYALPCAEETDMIAGIQPNVSLDALLAPLYGNNPTFPYRYVNVDATGTEVTFTAGQLIQFLPGTIIRGTSSSAAIKIYGSPTLHSRLFTRGDITKGVLIQDGGMTLQGGGAVTLY